MYLRYNYFQDELDHEALLDDVPSSDKWEMPFAKFSDVVGTFSITIINYIEEKGYDSAILLKDRNVLGNYQVGFYFTTEEYLDIKEKDPEFAKYMYHYQDRLAVDDEGNLYDIDDQEPASFDWYCYFLSTPKED